MDDTGLWIIAIVAALVVTGVVAALLVMVVRTAADIEAAVSEIWTRGQLVANNTIHIPVLHRTVERVEALRDGSRRILMQVRAIAGHAETCTGCPACIAGPRR